MPFVISTVFAQFPCHTSTSPYPYFCALFCLVCQHLHCQRHLLSSAILYKLTKTQKMSQSQSLQTVKVASYLRMPISRLPPQVTQTVTPRKILTTLLTTNRAMTVTVAKKTARNSPTTTSSILGT